MLCNVCNENVVGLKNKTYLSFCYVLFVFEFVFMLHSASLQFIRCTSHLTPHPFDTLWNLIDCRLTLKFMHQWILLRLQCFDFFPCRLHSEAIKRNHQKDNSQNVLNLSKYTGEISHTKIYKHITHCANQVKEKIKIYIIIHMKK